MGEFRKYLKFSPSAADQWHNCAASAIARSIPRSYESNIYAATGTGVMKKIEDVLNNFGDESDFDAFVGATETVDGLQVTYTEEDMEAAKVCFGEMSQVEMDGGELRIEMDIEGMIGTREKAFSRGRLDFLGIFPDKYLIADYKHGAGIPVSAINNMQLFSYLILVVGKFGPKESYELKIVQPRSPGEKISVCTMTHEQFASIADGLDGSIVRANKAAQEMVKSGEIPMTAYSVGNHCKYCPIEKSCPGRINLAVSVAAMTKFQFSPGGHFKFLLDNADEIRKILKAAEEQADAELLAGKEVFGYKLIESFGNRSLRKDLKPDEVATLKAAGLVKTEEVMPTIAALERAEKQKKIEKAAAFLADGTRRPKRVTWDTQGVLWGSTDDFEKGTMETTED